MSKGDIANGSRIETDVHIGTHIDAPWHSIPEGITIEQLSLDILVGPAFVVFLPDIHTITAEVLRKASIPDGTKRLLFRTDNSKIWEKGNQDFQNKYVALTADAAEWVVTQGIQLVGIDYLSIQQFTDDMETHNIMLRKNIIIVEGLNLTNVDQGMYELICLPLKIVDSEGSPARAVLRRLL